MNMLIHFSKQKTKDLKVYIYSKSTSRQADFGCKMTVK